MRPGPLLALLFAAVLAAAAPARASDCRAGTLYLTIDTGWSREAEEIAAILRERAIRATLFVADEPTHRGDTQLSDGWAAFWRARAAEGHVFASHTLRHWYFTSDPAPGRVRYASRRRGEGAEVLDQAAMCRELAAPVERLRAMAPDAVVLPLWRAPGGIVTANAVALGRGCGLTHQRWTTGGFLGDELPADAHPNAALLARNLRSIRAGEVLVMHWGVRSRAEPFARILPALLDGLLARGFCFAPLPADGIRG